MSLPESMENTDKAQMTTVANRPMVVLNTLKRSDDVYVQCRTASGQDVFIPLSKIFALYTKQLELQIKA